jgi:putative PIN family toxin of toxin-antitoxin system
VSLEPVPTPVVYDVNVLVDAVASGGGTSPFRSWPTPPPTSANASADCVGIVNDASEFSLWLSPHILSNAERVLAELFKWPRQDTDSYVEKLVMIAENSGGMVLEDVPRTVHDCGDHEDNMILDLAVEVGALMIVSNDTDLLSMNPWRATLIVTPRVFASRVDGMRRHRRH